MVRLKLPASSANLGAAFDAAALAVSIYLEVEAAPAAEFQVFATGRDADACAHVERNLILDTYVEALRANGQKPEPISLRVHNQIPLGMGLGSSAAARLAGLAIAAKIGRLGWSGDRVLAESARLEGHPDNVGACWLGGLVTARMGHDCQVQAIKIEPPVLWPLLVAIPPKALSTEEARGLLPATYTRADAVTNLQNSLLMLGAFSQGRGELLQFALGDRIHEPFREKACPLLPALRAQVGRHGILGCSLSGAGPGVLMVMEEHANLTRAAVEISDYLAQHGLEAQILPTRIENVGGVESYQEEAELAKDARL
ncbi:MAG TPA: homoserine kinase [Terriglobales bacterium]|nr:homoserine kinase [Terriglobales bacterium]